MKTERLEEKFLDYIDGTLSPEARSDFESALKQSEELQNSLEQYRSILSLERSIAGQSTEPGLGFSSKVMQKIETQSSGFFQRLYMHTVAQRKVWIGGLATCATLVLALKVAWQGTDSPEFRELQSVQPSQVMAPVAADIAEKKSEVAESIAPIVPLESLLSSGETQSQSDHQSAPARANAYSQKDKRSEPVIARELDDTKEVFGKVDSPAVPASAGEGVKPIAPEEIGATAGLAAKTGIEGAEFSDERISNSQSEGSNLGRVVEKLFGGMTTNFEEPDVIQPSARALALNQPQRSDTKNEQYIQATESPRIRTSADPISTFSLDVDTAGYSNIRRFLMQGKLPPVEAVRIEEMLNYFSYDYPSQGTKPFTLSYEGAPAPFDSGRYLLKLGIKAKQVSSGDQPWNLVFLIDVSGSMADANKLELLKRSLVILVNKMRSQDRIAIVTYADGAKVALESTNGTEKERILRAIEWLQPAGSTNGGAGIRLAYEQAQRHRVSGGVNRVILATDGDFNVGVTSLEGLTQLIEEKRKGGVTLTTIGVGSGNLKDANLEQLADKGNGSYFYLDSFNEARKVFETDLTGNMQLVAKDVKVQIEFNPQQVAEYRLIGYDNRKLGRQDFSNDSVDAGEVGSGHTVTALYELKLTGTQQASSSEQQEYRYGENRKAQILPPGEVSSELAFVKIRYKEPENSSSQVLQYAVESKDLRASFEQASDDFRFAAAISYLGQLLRKGSYIGRYTFADVLKLAESAVGSDREGQRREFLALVRNAQHAK